MPHKINPKLAKGIIANAQKIYSLPGVGSYSSVRPYEGDSSQYMLFDGLIEESLQLMTEILLRTEELTRTIQIKEDRMLENAYRNEGLDNSEHLMMEMAERLGKDQAHSLIYDIAIKTSAYGEDFLTNLKENDLISEKYTEEELKELIDPRSYIGRAPQLAQKMSEKAKEKANNLLEK